MCDYTRENYAPDLNSSNIFVGKEPFCVPLRFGLSDVELKPDVSSTYPLLHGRGVAQEYVSVIFFYELDCAIICETVISY